MRLCQTGGARCVKASPQGPIALTGDRPSSHTRPAPQLDSQTPLMTTQSAHSQSSHMFKHHTGWLTASHNLLY